MLFRLSVLKKIMSQELHANIVNFDFVLLILLFYTSALKKDTNLLNQISHQRYDFQTENHFHIQFQKKFD